MNALSTGNKLVATLAAILLAGFTAVNLVSYFVSGASVRKALIDNELPLTSDNIYSEIQTSLLRPIYISSLMANDTFLKDWMLEGERDLGRITRYLGEIRDKYEVFSTFVVSDLTHRYYHFGGVLKTVSPDAPKDGWFFSMATHPQNYRVDVDTNEAEKNRLTIFVNHKLFDHDGRFIGVTGLGLDAVSLSETIERYRDEYRREIYFVDREGLIKGHVDNAIIDRASIRELPGVSTVAEDVLGGDTGSLQYATDDDAIFLTYRFIPELDWYLVVEQRESAALQPIRQALYFNLAVSLVITLVVLLISGYTARHFQRRLEAMAQTDKLTGLINRQYFDAVCESALRSSGRRAKPLSLLIFDIDHFKAINDRGGHLAGDAVLRAVAEAARDAARQSDVASRWGGDEFVLLLQDCDEAGARRIAEALRARIREVAGPAGEAVTISAGVAQSRDGDSYDDLVGRADAALYRAKQAGRDRVLGRQVGQGADGAADATI